MVSGLGIGFVRFTGTKMGERQFWERQKSLVPLHAPHITTVEILVILVGQGVEPLPMQTQQSSQKISNLDLPLHV